MPRQTQQTACEKQKKRMRFFSLLMFWFGNKKLTEWGIAFCSKMLSEMQDEYCDYIRQLNSGLIKKVIPISSDYYRFRYDSELYAKYVKVSEPSFRLEGFVLKDDSGNIMDGFIGFIDGIVSYFSIKKRVSVANLNVSAENVIKSTTLERLPKKIMTILCQYDGIDISAVNRIDFKNFVIYRLIEIGDSFIGIEESGEFVEVANRTLEVKPFIGNISEFLMNAGKAYRYEALPKKILNIINQHEGIDICYIYRVDIENKTLYHMIDAEDGDFIGIEGSEGKFAYVSHDPLEINIITKDINIYKVNAGNQLIYHLLDTESESFIGVTDYTEFVEVDNNKLEVKPLEKTFLEYLNDWQKN